MAATLDLLGDWKRTQYAGDLRAADADKEVVLMGWVHRRRDLGNLIFIDLRDRGGIAQIVFNKELGAGGARARGGIARGIRDGGARASGAAAEAQSRAGQRRSGSVRLGAAHPEHGEDAAVRGRRRSERERRDAAALSLSRSAAPAPAAQYRAAPPHLSGDSQNAGRAGLLRNRDAHADALDARRARATTWCPAACITGNFTRCRNRRRSSSRS